MEQQLEVEISFVKICLGSFVGNPCEEGRESYLLRKLGSFPADEMLKDQLKGYIVMEKDKLEKQLFKLEDLLPSKLFTVSFSPFL
jgi:hypothetical protein